MANLPQSEPTLISLIDLMLCDLSIQDNLGQQYDLTPLARSQGNWVVLDTRATHTDLHYYINVCRPVNPAENMTCPGNLTVTLILTTVQYTYIDILYIDISLYIDGFSNSRIFPSLSLLNNFSYIDLLYLQTLIYQHVFGHA